MLARNFALAVLAALVAVLAALVAVPSVASAAKPAARYYLALGDSLSQGVQPDVRGVSLETDQGYPDQLFAIERRQIPSLKLVKLGCPGDTTTAWRGGGRDG